MIHPVTVDQLRNLTDRAGGGLSPDEQQRLRDGINQLEYAEAEVARLRADIALDRAQQWPQRLGRAEKALREARRLHQEKCPLAQGRLNDAYGCGMCDALTAPARETT